LLEEEVRSLDFNLKLTDQFPLGGRLRFFVKFWRRVTSNPDVISLILGARIPFLSDPVQKRVPPPCVFNMEETCEVRKMVSELLASEVIVPVDPQSDQFVS
jgi:hypothetical protein